jgi:hypothetical protein
VPAIRVLVRSLVSLTHFHRTTHIKTIRRDFFIR